MAAEGAAKKHCQSAIDTVCKRISIKFSHYPEFGDKFKAVCKTEAFDDDIEILMEDVAEGYDDSTILEALDEDLNFKEDKEVLCKSIHYILKTFKPPATAFDLGMSASLNRKIASILKDNTTKIS